MIYRLKELQGDTIAVPQLVFSKLGIAEEYNVRVALYVLATGITDPDKICADLKLRSRISAESALSFWAGAGLLVSERGAAPAPAAEPARVDLASVANDPYVAVLCQEAQSIFGKTLSRSEMQRLVGLYLNDGWQPDVSLLCYVAGLHRIRPAECDSRRTDRTRHLSQRMHRYHTGNC